MHNDLDFLEGLDGDGPNHEWLMCWKTGVTAEAPSDWLIIEHGIIWHTKGLPTVSQLFASHGTLTNSACEKEVGI
jgi:hypothetical protein